MKAGPLSNQESKKRILFVDDEPDMTRMLKMAPEGVGLAIDTYYDPMLALKNFKPNLYDLVILDIIMPKLDGFGLYEQLKKMDPGIKICFLTSSESYREELRKRKYRGLNSELFLEMPLPIKEIISEIKMRVG